MTSTLLIGILSVVVALDHVLAGIPSVNANSTFQLVTKILLSLAGVVPGSTGTK